MKNEVRTPLPLALIHNDLFYLFSDGQVPGDDKLEVLATVAGYHSNRVDDNLELLATVATSCSGGGGDGKTLKLIVESCPYVDLCACK